MSKFGKHGVRCDWCGKIANNPNGEYTRQDDSVGYILQPEWERFPGGDPTRASVSSSNDICEECAGNQCPACGSASVVHLTPTVAGPVGWGGRCKACGHRWSFTATP